MLSNLMFSLSVTMPLFLVIALGYLIRRGGMLDEGFVRSAGKFNFYVTLPALVFRDMAGSDFRSIMDRQMILFCAGVTAGSFFLIWLVAHFVMKNGGQTAALVQGSFRSSAALLGFALMESIYGSTEMMPLMILGAVPLYNLLSVVVLVVEGGKKGDGFLKILFRSVFKTITNPILIALALGMLASYFSVPIPAIPAKLIGYLAVMASPLALLTVGANFRFTDLKRVSGAVVMASLLKLVILAAVFLPPAIWLGFRDQKLAAILIMLASPATPASFTMCQQMGGDADLSGSVVVVTTLFSAVTLTAWIFVLRYFGYMVG